MACKEKYNKVIDILLRDTEPFRSDTGEALQEYTVLHTVFSTIKTNNRTQSFTTWEGVNINNSTINIVITTRDFFNDVDTSNKVRFQGKFYNIQNIENKDMRNRHLVLYCGQEGDENLLSVR